MIINILLHTYPLVHSEHSRTQTHTKHEESKMIHSIEIHIKSTFQRDKHRLPREAPNASEKNETKRGINNKNVVEIVDKR